MTISVATLMGAIIKFIANTELEATGKKGEESKQANPAEQEGMQDPQNDVALAHDANHQEIGGREQKWNAEQTTSYVHSYSTIKCESQPYPSL
jgi:hypothetical protein